jgi:hypothetical protein
VAAAAARPRADGGRGWPGARSRFPAARLSDERDRPQQRYRHDALSSGYRRFRAVQAGRQRGWPGHRCGVAVQLAAAVVAVHGPRLKIEEVSVRTQCGFRPDRFVDCTPVAERKETGDGRAVVPARPLPRLHQIELGSSPQACLSGQAEALHLVAWQRNIAKSCTLANSGAEPPAGRGENVFGVGANPVHLDEVELPPAGRAAGGADPLLRRGGWTPGSWRRSSARRRGWCGGCRPACLQVERGPHAGVVGIHRESEAAATNGRRDRFPFPAFGRC